MNQSTILLPNSWSKALRQSDPVQSLHRLAIAGSWGVRVELQAHGGQIRRVYRREASELHDLDLYAVSSVFARVDVWWTMPTSAVSPLVSPLALEPRDTLRDGIFPPGKECHNTT